MKNDNKKINFEDAVILADWDNTILRRRENNLLLSNNQIGILYKYGIDYKHYANIRELLFEIENCLNDIYDEELDSVGKQLSEFIYYNETKK